MALALSTNEITAALRMRIKRLERQIINLKVIIETMKANKKTFAAMHRYELAEKAHTEIIKRTIIAFKKLSDEGYMTYNEFAFLLMGSTNESFQLEECVKVFGYLGRFVKRDMRACIDAGFFKKKRNPTGFYLTYEGELRLKSLIKRIYEENPTPGARVVINRVKKR